MSASKKYPLRSIMFLALVLIQAYAYSQTGHRNYRIVVQGPDTFALVPAAAISSANAVKVFSSGCKEVADSCLIQLRDLKAIQSAQKIIISKQDTALNDCVDAVNDCRAKLNKERRDNSKIKKQRNGFAGLSLLLLVLLWI